MKGSKRQYVIQTSTGRTVTEFLQPSINEIINNTEDEVYFALQDEIDLVLDLRKEESMYFQPNRDNNNSKGIITRVK